MYCYYGNVKVSNSVKLHAKPYGGTNNIEQRGVKLQEIIEFNWENNRVMMYSDFKADLLIPNATLQFVCVRFSKTFAKNVQSR